MKFFADKPLKIWFCRHAPVGAFVATLVCGAALVVAPFGGVVRAQQDQQDQEMGGKPAAASNSTDNKAADIQLLKQFKGKLPITELSEDEAICTR